MQATSSRWLGTTLGQYKSEQGKKTVSQSRSGGTTQGLAGVTSSFSCLSGSVGCTQEPLKMERSLALPF